MTSYHKSSEMNQTNLANCPVGPNPENLGSAKVGDINMASTTRETHMTHPYPFDALGWTIERRSKGRTVTGRDGQAYRQRQPGSRRVTHGQSLPRVFVDRRDKP